MTDPVRARVLVVDDEPNIRESIRRALARIGHTVDAAPDAQTALARLDRSPVDLVLCDIKLPGTDGIELLGKIRESHPETVVVMITGYASIESAVTAIKRGASDYVPKPFNPEQLRHVVAKALEQKRLQEENVYLKGELRHLFGERVVVGQSRAMQRLFEVARTVAATDSSVLIVGESGTGKEVVARFIHAESPRKDSPFVTVNCAAIPPNLLESELFGHRRGAFTGAVYSRRGSFELADGGTLFLDEIGEMPVEMQAKILRALEERQVKRVGSEEPIAVNARIIAATNKELEQEIKAGKFREDLYWRLNVVQLVVPPLRERPEDVVPLARHFLALYRQELKKAVPDFSAEVLEAFARYDWPGNVRELRNAVERAVIFAEAGTPIRVGHLPPHIRQENPRGLASASRGFRTLREMEIQYIREVLEACGGNRTRAAEILGVSPVTLWRKLGRESAGEGEQEPAQSG
ncbi:MAG: sigma-54-dependent Fis family transcriptional regulator [Candidatus Rokubacteria bacterium]|nr:sigma-54-dependent Fis family transcriptional regulator [Candidatus Rokubacteria bacterium]